MHPTLRELCLISDLHFKTVLSLLLFQNSVPDPEWRGTSRTAGSEGKIHVNVGQKMPEYVSVLNDKSKKMFYLLTKYNIGHATEIIKHDSQRCWAPIQQST